MGFSFLRRESPNGGSWGVREGCGKIFLVRSAFFVWVSALCTLRLFLGKEVVMDRKKFEKEILAKSKGGKIPCAVCFKLAEECEISKREMGKILDEMKIKVSQCQLGCFE